MRPRPKMRRREGAPFVRSAGLNYPDVLAQIRLPVYAHNAVRNVQSTGNHPLASQLPPVRPPVRPPATSSASYLAIAVTAAAAFAGGRKRKRERRKRRRWKCGGGGGGVEKEEEELEPMYPAYAVCVLRGWAHIDRYVLPVAR